MKNTREWIETAKMGETLLLFVIFSASFSRHRVERLTLQGFAFELTIFSVTQRIPTRNSNCRS